MNTNIEVFLTLLVTTMFLSSVFVDIKRKKREWTEGNRINKHPDKEIKDHSKANWHNGFQLATGTILFFLFMAWALKFGWLDQGIIPPDGY